MRKVLKIAQQPISLEMPIGEEEDSHLRDFIEDRGVLAKYQGKIRLNFRDFPLRQIHSKAQSAAEAARCAGEQGIFWEYHDALYG